MRSLMAILMIITIVLVSFTGCGADKEIIDIDSIDNISIVCYSTIDDYTNHCETELVEMSDTTQFVEVCKLINSTANSNSTSQPLDFPRYVITIVFSNGNTSTFSIDQDNRIASDILGGGNYLPSEQNDYYMQVSTIMDSVFDTNK